MYNRAYNCDFNTLMRIKATRLKPLYNNYNIPWRTLSEQTIMSNSAAIRSIPHWEEKLANEADRKQWIADMKGKGLTDKQASYVISELFYYAKLLSFIRNSGSDAKLSLADMVWYTDIPESSDLAQDFKTSLSKMLRTMPWNRYNWKIRKGKEYVTVELIVNPSLYSLVYGFTPILPKPMTSPQEALSLPSFGAVPESIDIWRRAVCHLNESMTSKDKGKEEDGGKDFEQSDTAANGFVPYDIEYLYKIDKEGRHWLPTDIYVNEDGSVDFKSYINNIHPEEHVDMYRAISKVLSKAIPLLEQALTDWEHFRDLRVPYTYYNCLKFPEVLAAFNEDEYEDEKFSEAYETWRSSIIDTTLHPDDFVEPERPLAAYSLRNKNLQVVVEITDKEMPPFSTTGAENIIATAIYYYSVEGEEKRSIRFLEGIESDSDTIEDIRDQIAHEILYGGKRWEGSYYIEQDAGCIDIVQGRIICYPNIYKISNSPERKGLKRLTMYFVDPSIRIISTAIVPPQQKDWWMKAVSSAPSRISMLPAEIQDMVFEEVDTPMSFEQAFDISKKPNGDICSGATYNFDTDRFYCKVGSRFEESDIPDYLDLFDNP